VREFELFSAESSDQHQVDLTATGGLQEFLASFPPHRPGVHLADSAYRWSAAPGCILPHRLILHRQRLLVIRLNARIDPPATFWPASVSGQKRAASDLRAINARSIWTRNQTACWAVSVRC